MMKKEQPEQNFNFLDRNYQEEYKDRNTMRQILSSSMSCLQPDMATEYYEIGDGLLVGMYFKNPPGRLIRHQWTNPIKVFPDFQDWNQFVKEEGVPVVADQLLDISADNVGVLRCNTKYCFPQDNSIININKYNICQKRMGESKIIKDNFIFGLTERTQAFRNKVQGHDGLRNRDAKDKADRNCDFWLLFENGVRLLVEMQEH